MNNEYAQMGYELERVLINVDLDIHITSHHCPIDSLMSMRPYRVSIKNSKRYKIKLDFQFRRLSNVLLSWAVIIARNRNSYKWKN